MWYYEVLKDSLRKRATFIPEDELFDFILTYGKNNALYKSVFMYPEKDAEILTSKKTVADHFCERTAYWIPVDIDKGNSSDEHVLNKLKASLLTLFDAGLTEDNIVIWFSGTGYHIDIHGGSFKLPPSIDYPFIIKQTMIKIFPELSNDNSIYTRTGVIRLPFSLNQKSGLYKIPLSLAEVNTLTWEEIHSRAKDYEAVKERIQWFVDELSNKYGEEELSHLVSEQVPQVRELTKTSEPCNIVSCIHKIWTEGATEGSRNNAVMRLASHFRRSGFPSEAAKAAILQWNNNSLDENIVLAKIEYTYNKGYKFGCNDFLLKQYCSTHCQHYKHKNMSLEIYTADDMQKALEERLTTDFSNRVLHLDRRLGLPENADCKIYPGELVTIFGPTGCNKSTFVQNLLLGMDFVNNSIDRTNQLSAVYFAPELAVWLTHRRSLQIATDLDKNTISVNAKSAYRTAKPLIDHMKVVQIAPTLAQIEQAVLEQNCEVVVIDYIELIEREGSLNEEQFIKHVMKRLSELAVQKDIIVIAMSQISRNYSRAGVLDLYAGHGSGGIEKSSRKVIGINGKQGERVRTLEMYKNQDGDLFNVTLEVQPSYRLKRID